MTGPPVNPSWCLRTGRMRLVPVGSDDLAELIVLKGDPRVYAAMLGGVRSPLDVREDLAEEIAFWGAHGIGMWAARPSMGGALLGVTGLHLRPDGRGFGLRFAFHQAARGGGLAREAASAALRYAHDVRGLDRVVAVARADNVGSRQVLGGIGMRHVETFPRGGAIMLMFESRRPVTG